MSDATAAATIQSMQVPKRDRGGGGTCQRMTVAREANAEPLLIYGEILLFDQN